MAGIFTFRSRKCTGATNSINNETGPFECIVQWTWTWIFNAVVNAINFTLAFPATKPLYNNQTSEFIQKEGALNPE